MPAPVDFRMKDLKKEINTALSKTLMMMSGRGGKASLKVRKKLILFFKINRLLFVIINLIIKNKMEKVSKEGQISPLSLNFILLKHLINLR